MCGAGKHHSRSNDQPVEPAEGVELQDALVHLDVIVDVVNETRQQRRHAHHPCGQGSEVAPLPIPIQPIGLVQMEHVVGLRLADDEVVAQDDCQIIHVRGSSPAFPYRGWRGDQACHLLPTNGPRKIEYPPTKLKNRDARAWITHGFIAKPRIAQRTCPRLWQSVPENLSMFSWIFRFLPNVHVFREDSHDIMGKGNTVSGDIYKRKSVSCMPTS